MATNPRQDRPRLLSGLGLPLRAMVEMARHPEERGPLLLVVSLLLAGTVFYVAVEGFTVVDAFYFSAMSLATVGFGDIVPTTDVGKIFTVVYVLSGIGILVSFFTALAAKSLALQSERRERRAAHGDS